MIGASQRDQDPAMAMSPPAIMLNVLAGRTTTSGGRCKNWTSDAAPSRRNREQKSYRPRNPGSWKELLVDLKARGLVVAPQVAIGDGALGFWKALDEAFPTTRHQRCWLHKTLNVLDKLPKSMQPNAHKDLREIWLSPSRGAAEAAMTTFAEKYAPKYDKAVECLTKDQQTLLTFFDLPADHWDHLRTSNPIESVFATVRHRTVRMKVRRRTPRVSWCSNW